MIKTIFCLSMPGGHMTYLALLTKLLLNQLPVNYDYITNNGSAHNVEKFLPPHLEYDYFFEWDTWFETALDNFTVNNICVFKDSWASTNLHVWENKLNSIDNISCLLSSPISKIDWYYSWLNLTDKMPIGLFGHLKKNSPLFPIWHMLPKKHKKVAMLKSMPVFPIKENINLSINHLRFKTTTILSKDFPNIINQFLISSDFDSNLTSEINNFHEYFVEKQISNYTRAQQLSQNIRWEPRNMFDELLFSWIDTNPWEGLE